MVAVTLVPIDKRTLIYGSADAGKTVFTGDEVLNAQLQKSAEILNLKSHFVGHKKTLHSAADLEGHKPEVREGSESC